MNCPRCKTVLKADKIKDFKARFEVDYCASCGGTWFDKNELSQIEHVIEPTLLEIRKVPTKTKQQEPLCCPCCNNLQYLQKAEHPRDKKVIIDYCPSCKGIWLDKGELAAIQKENWLITIGKIFKWLVGED
ncbi:zf-TFIIB domain-containing protein [Carboxylicivirga marina]|uniref:TFIIB-type zinc ribbon-containing protein n=1 Tax=Carboxylicivirga marina TaxID=2800988 RepID=UPI002595203D|nr:zf-TFIIB domain-containing protein [uncultured Carboxylicivirga sp.]